MAERKTKIHVVNGNRELTLEFPDDVDTTIDSWTCIFRSILAWMTFDFQLISEVIKESES